MPLQFKPQFWIIIGVVLLVVLIGGAVLANNGAKKAVPTPTPTPIPTVAAPTPTPQPATVTFTVNSVIGISSISVINQNTNAHWTLIPAEMPHPYTVNYGDTLTFKVTSIPGYRFNMWEFGDGTVHSPDSNGYLTWKITGSLVMDPHFLMDVIP